jgi:formylmethanofuran dehydrogenase subunit C
MKKVLLTLIVLGIASFLNAQDLVQAVENIAKEKIQQDAKVAIANQSEVKVENGSTIEAKSEMESDNKNFGVIGTVVAVGSDVEISNSDIKAESKMNSGNVNVGTVGAVILGAH